MKIGELNGYELHMPTRGGKAGKGLNLTSSIQVRKDGIIVRQFRFVREHSAAAIFRAKHFIEKQSQ